MATWTQTEAHVAQRQGRTKVVWRTLQRRWPLRPRTTHAPREDSRAKCLDRRNSLAPGPMVNRTAQTARQRTRAHGVHAAQWARRLPVPRCPARPDSVLRSPRASRPLGAAARWGRAVLQRREAVPMVPTGRVAPAATSDSGTTMAARKAGRTEGASHRSRRTTWVRSRAAHLTPRTAWLAQARRRDAQALSARREREPLLSGAPRSSFFLSLIHI